MLNFYHKTIIPVFAPLTSNKQVALLIKEYYCSIIARFRSSRETAVKFIRKQYHHYLRKLQKSDFLVKMVRELKKSYYKIKERADVYFPIVKQNIVKYLNKSTFIGLLCSK